MAFLGNIIIYIIMIGVIVGGVASAINPESSLGKEFVAGIHSIGPVFLVQAGIMAAIPILSDLITNLLGPIFDAIGSDVSIAATSIIAIDMGGYQLANALAKNTDTWITASFVGYSAGATIVYLIPIGLAMLSKKDQKYLALGVMAGLICIPFSVLVTILISTFSHVPFREIISTQSPATHYLGLSFLAILKLLLPLFIFCFLLVIGLIASPNKMVDGFIMFGKCIDFAIKIVLAISIVEYFTGVFSVLFGGWAFDPMFADKGELFRAIEISGYLGIMLAGTFPLCYLFRKYAKAPMRFLGSKLNMTETGVVGFIFVFANIIAVYHLFKDMDSRDKVICIAMGVCAQGLMGGQLAFTANFQPTLILPVVIGKLFGGIMAVIIAVKLIIPSSMESEAIAFKSN